MTVPEKTKREVGKAYVYLVWDSKLLVFSQPDFPEAGIQVPGGTLDPDETPEAGARREAQEETGLKLEELAFERLGETKFLHPNGELHHRHFFRVEAPGPYPETWDHWELYDAGGQGPILFHFRWHDLRNSVELAAEQGSFLEFL